MDVISSRSPKDPLQPIEPDNVFGFDSNAFNYPEPRKVTPRTRQGSEQMYVNEFDFGDNGMQNRKGSVDSQRMQRMSRRKTSQQVDENKPGSDRKESKGKLEDQAFTIELGNIMGNIKSCASKIKEKVKAQKEFNQSIIAINETDQFDIGKQENGADVSMIFNDNMRANDISIIKTHEMGSGKYHDKSATFSPINQLFHGDMSFNEHHKGEFIEPFLNDNDQDQPITIERAKFEKMLVDLSTKHQAEKFSLRQETFVYQKIIKGLISKIQTLQDQIFQRDRELITLEKLCVINDKLKYENDHLRHDNLTLSSKVELMKTLMLEFDTQRIEEFQDDKFIIEQLMIENTQLKQLLLIPDSFPDLDMTQIHERLTQAEALLTPTDTLEPSIPAEVQELMYERIEEKNQERKVKDEMRKLAEEEVMTQLKMAEDFFKKNKQQYNFYQDNDDEEEEDRDDDMEREDDPTPEVGADDPNPPANEEPTENPWTHTMEAQQQQEQSIEEEEQQPDEKISE